jgi:hypothetical protein
MFTPLFFVALVLLFIALFGSRFLTERATKLLSRDEKLALLDSFPRLRIFGTLPLVLFIFLFFGIPYLPPALIWPAYFIGWVLFALYFAIMHRIVSRKLKELGINEGYRAAYNNARLVFWSGFVAFFVISALGPFVAR